MHAVLWAFIENSRLSRKTANKGARYRNKPSFKSIAFVNIWKICTKLGMA